MGVWLWCCVVLFVGCVWGLDSSYTIVNTYPHDTNAFTQGLLVDPRDPNYFLEGKKLRVSVGCEV